MLSALLLTVLPAAEPEKPLEIPIKEWAAMSDPESKANLATLQKYDGKLVKATGRAVFSDRGDYFLRVPIGGGKTKSMPLQWSESKAADRAKKQIEDAGDRGLALTVYARAVFSAVADDGKRTYFLKSLHEVTTEPPK